MSKTTEIVAVTDVKPAVTGAPITETMERVLGPVDVISVEQTPRGCLQEMLGCSAKSEYKLYAGLREEFAKSIFPDEEPKSAEQIGHMLEQSAFCPDRCFWGGMRQFDLPITVPDENGEQMLLNTKGFSLPTHCLVHTGDYGDYTLPCCCMLPSIKTKAPDGTVIGTSKYICDGYLYVPKIKTYNADGNEQYLIRPDTCCLGCCPTCECGGGKGGSCLYMPFYIRDPQTKEKLPGGAGAKGLPAQIRKLWSGVAKEVCTSADNFYIVFPEDTPATVKGALIGSTILLDFTVFEEKDGGCFVIQW